MGNWVPLKEEQERLRQFSATVADTMSLLRADVPAFVPRRCSEPLAEDNSQYLGANRYPNGNYYTAEASGNQPYMIPNTSELPIGTWPVGNTGSSGNYSLQRNKETEQNGNFLHISQRPASYSHRTRRDNRNANTFVNSPVSENVYSDGRGKSKDDKRKFNSAIRDKQEGAPTPRKKEKQRGRGGKHWNPTRIDNFSSAKKGVQIMSKGTTTEESALCQIPEKVFIDDKEEFPELGTPFNAEKLVSFLPATMRSADVSKCDICTTEGCEQRKDVCTTVVDSAVPYAAVTNKNVFPNGTALKTEDKGLGARPRERENRVRYNSRTKKDLRSSSASHKKSRDKDYSDLNESASKNASSDEKADKNKLNFYSNAEYKSVREKRLKEKERMKNRLSRTSKVSLNAPAGTVSHFGQVLKSSSFDIEDSTSENVPLAEDKEEKRPLTEAELEKKRKKTQLRKEKRKRERERKMMEKRMRDTGDTKIQVISQKAKAFSERKAMGISQNEEKFSVRFYEAEYPELGVSSVVKSSAAPAATKSYSTDSDWESVTEPESVETTSVNETDLMLTEEDEHKIDSLYSFVLQSAAPAPTRGILKPVNSLPGPPAPTKSEKKKKKKTKKKKEEKVKTRSTATLTLADMIIFERPRVKRDKSERVRGSIVRRVRDPGRYTGNVLDASAPSRRRKEKEGGKKKKHSCLKKIILQERESRREQRLLLRGATMPDVKARMIHEDAEIMVKPEASFRETTSTLKPEDRLILQAQQIDGNAAAASYPKTENGQRRVDDIISLALQDIRTNPKLWLHNRKFRDYCNHFLNPQLDTHVTHMIQDLVRFQDRLYHKDPVKARARRRMVIGLKEVNKHLKINKLKCVIIAPDLEKVPTAGGLDEKIYEIISLAESTSIPTVFGLKKKTLGHLCKKKVPVSCIGIINYQGAEEHFLKMLEAVEELKTSYDRAYRSLAHQLPGGNMKVNEVKTEDRVATPKEEVKTTEEQKSASADVKTEPEASAHEVNSSFLDQLRRQMSLSTDARESNSSFEEQLEKSRAGVGAL